MLPSSTMPRWWSSNRRRRLALIGVVTVGMVSTSVFSPTAANAAVPTFPDNIVIFPDRDFVSIDGYDAHIGATATVEVFRDGAGIIGSAQGKLAGGSPTLEINHPGGACWGAGTGLDVTPDIQPGDRVVVKIGGMAVGDATAQDAAVSDTADGPAYALNGTTLVVHGHLAANVNPAQFEQRIINPDLTGTDVGRRDVSATDPVLTPGPKGGYRSKLEVTGSTFTATYEFDRPETAQVAAAGQMRVLSWQEQDADGNRQGLTIAEFGELGGPGLGGCPNGPTKTGPRAPSHVTAVRSADLKSIKLGWTPATAIPGTPAITGYRVVAVAATKNGAGEQDEIGKRIANPAATGVTIGGLSDKEMYNVEVRSVSGAGETFPIQPVHVVEPGEDMTPPTVGASPAGGSFPVPQMVTLTANEPGSEMYYSLKGVNIVDGGMLSTDASVTRYTGPFTISQSTKLTYVAFDPSGNMSQEGEQTFAITNDPVPAVPAFTGTPVSGLGSVTLTWSAPDAGAPGLTIDEYTVRAYLGGKTVTKTTPGNVTMLEFTDLQGDQPYQFTVSAKNTHGYGPESTKTDPVAPRGLLVANAGADQSGVVRGATVNLDGSGSTAHAGVTYQWEQLLASPSDPDKVTLTGANGFKPSFVYPMFQYPMTNSPLVFRLTVTDTDTNVSRTDEVMVGSKPDSVTIATGRYRAGNELRADGSGTRVGATITIHAGSLSGPVIGQVPVTAAVPLAGGSWTIRLRGNQVPATKQPIWIESNYGGTAGPFTLG